MIQSSQVGDIPRSTVNRGGMFPQGCELVFGEKEGLEVKEDRWTSKSNSPEDTGA